MKKSRLILAIIAMAIVAIAVAVVSCKKEKQDQTSNKMEQSVQSSDNMDEYIKSFKEKLLSAEKDDELISIEEAQLNLGNLLNFDFDDPNYATNVLQYDTLHVGLMLKDGQVELSQLAVTYQEAFGQVLDVFNAAIFPEKTVFGIHCEIENKAKSNDADVVITMVTRGLTDDPLKLDFDEDECWGTVNYGGMCEGTGGGNYGAFQMIAMIATNRLTLNNWEISCTDGQRVVFSNYLNVFVMPGYGSDFDPLSPVGGQELYTNHHIYDTCLCYEALHYFLEKSIEIGEEHKPYHHIIYGYASHLNLPETSNCGWQELQVAYRKFWCSDEPTQY